MKKLILPILLAALAPCSLVAKSAAPIMPVVSGEDLNGKRWVAPLDFPANMTLVVFGFEEEQQAAIDTWIHGMNLNSPSSKIAWIEMPLIENPGMFLRWFINKGMQGGIPDAKIRAHVWTAYTDRKAFMKSSGMTSEKEVYALVIDRDGRILAREKGNFSREGASRLRQALKK